MHLKACRALQLCANKSAKVHNHQSIDHTIFTDTGRLCQSLARDSFQLSYT